MVVQTGEGDLFTTEARSVALKNDSEENTDNYLATVSGAPHKLSSLTFLQLFLSHIP
jgi:hypothetical protein